MQILVVGDNPQAATLGRALTLAGFDSVTPQCSTVSALACSAVVLDCDRPRCNGDCPFRQFRANGHRRSVLVIAARRPHETPSRCLESGADDFLARRYRDWELQARVRALIRRANICRTGAPPVVSAPVHSTGDAPALQSLLTVADLTLDLLTRKAKRGSREIELTPREFELLSHLMRHAGEACRRKDILEQAWAYRGRTRTSVLDTYINRLRAKLDVGPETKLIHTVHGVGYLLKADHISR